MAEQENLRIVKKSETQYDVMSGSQVLTSFKSRAQAQAYVSRRRKASSKA